MNSEPYLTKKRKKRKGMPETNEYTDIPWNVPSYILTMLQKKIKENENT